MTIQVKSKRELIETISRYDVVSFDIFDTLIMRKTLTPDDVFGIVANKIKNSGNNLDYVNNRQRAVLENQIPNPNIYEIYDKFAELTGIMETQKKKLLELEIQVEKNAFIRREQMVEVLREAKEMGKRIYLITDMYLPRDIIADVLNSLNITAYDDILVSCDYRTLKGEELFERFKEKYSAESYLHIGDNLYSDIECAEKHGMDSAPIESAIRLMRNSVYAKLEESAESLLERNVLGMFIAKMFNSPFSLVEHEPLKLQEMVELFVSPIAYLLVSGLKNKVQEEKYDKVLFASRDGYLLQKMYQLVKDDKMPEGIYFYTSRKAVVGVNLVDEDKILWLANLSYSYTKDEILSKVFQIEGGSYNEQNDYNEYILEYKDAIIAKSTELRRNYEQYLSSLEIGEGKYLFVDLVTSGTCQMYLQELIRGKIEGYYLCKLRTTEIKKEALRCYSLFPVTDINNYESGFYRIYYLFEAILTSFEASLKCFDIGGVPVFEEEKRSKEELICLSSIQEEMLSYFLSMVYLCEGCEGRAEMLVDSLIKIFLEKNMRLQEEFSVVLWDDWMNTKHIIKSFDGND